MEHVMERFQRLPLGNICDANGKRGSMDPAIRPVDPSLHMVGRAYTVRCHPGDNLAIHKAITEAPDGSVLVIDAGGYTGGGPYRRDHVLCLHAAGDSGSGHRRYLPGCGRYPGAGLPGVFPGL